MPREPVYKAPPPQPASPPVAQPPPVPSAGAVTNWATRNPICSQLEQRLAQDGQRSRQTREQLPRLEAEIRQVDKAYQSNQSQLDKECYEFFFFSKTLIQSRRCIGLSREAEASKRKLGELEAQRQQLMGTSTTSHKDDIIRELARHNCGPGYAQEANRQNSGRSIWQDDEGGGPDAGSRYGTLPYATYRTLCVRLCDGYYFPISFSTLPNHFSKDAEACQSKCAAPVELYYHQNPGGAVDQMIAMKNQEPYTRLKTAFRYRKELVAGCSCKQAEYAPQTPASDRRAEGPPTQSKP